MGTLRTWHRWIGIIAAIILILSAITGTLLVYKKQLVYWFVADGTALDPGYAIDQMAVELDRISRLIPAGEKVLIKAPNEVEPYWTLTQPKGNIEMFSVGTLTEYRDEWNLLPFFAFIRHLHTELFAGIVGEWVYLVAGICGLTLTLTGLILWWPARRMFRWRWIWPKPFRWGLLVQYHRHSGALTFPVLLVVIVTGSVMLWQKLVMPLLPPVPVTNLEIDGDLRKKGSTKEAPSKWLLRAHRQVPDGWPTYIRLPSLETDETTFRFKLPGEWHPNGRTSVRIHTRAGTMQVTQRSDQGDIGRRLLNQVYPLHSGYGMNSVYMLVIITSGVTLIWLSCTGVVSYARKRRTKA